jgi:hypothetical protein
LHQVIKIGQRLQHLIDRICDDGLHGILLDIIGLGGETPPTTRAELPAA